MEQENNNKSLDFIRTIITEDIANNKNEGRVATRFPLSQMDIYILVMPNLSASILEQPRNLEAPAISDLMILIRRKRILSTLIL